MTRENLIAALTSAAEELGYTASFSGDRQRAVKMSGLPLMWVAPLKVVAASGRSDCRVTYRVTAKLLIQSDRMSVDAEQLWQILERDAIDLFHKIDSSPLVCSASGFGCTPCAVSQSPTGDAAMTVEFEAEMFYCA